MWGRSTKQRKAQNRRNLAHRRERERRELVDAEPLAALPSFRAWQGRAYSHGELSAMDWNQLMAAMRAGVFGGVQ